MYVLLSRLQCRASRSPLSSERLALPLRSLLLFALSSKAYAYPRAAQRLPLRVFLARSRLDVESLALSFCRAERCKQVSRSKQLLLRFLSFLAQSARKLSSSAAQPVFFFFFFSLQRCSKPARSDIEPSGSKRLEQGARSGLLPIGLLKRTEVALVRAAAPLSHSLLRRHREHSIELLSSEKGGARKQY